MNATITDAELEVMKVLWRENRPVLFTDIRLELEETKKWKTSTIQTLVYRLRDKGVIHSIPGSMARYVTDVPKAEYLRSEGQSFIDKLFDGSARNLVAALCQNGQLTEQDIAELRDYFNAGGDGNG
ncbi:MAG: BlaI/MecI/CopY family transcriptional regulator [Clostridiales bacterium]|nr:BlaI/MecI/CopY family transcriptional regulator [Clostridiales bacterium]